MENTLGLAHFLNHADIVARFLLAVLALASLGTWYLVFDGWMKIGRQRKKSAAFLAEFREAANFEALTKRLRSRPPEDPFAALALRGIATIEHCREAQGADRLAVDAGSPAELLVRALRRAIDEERHRLESAQTFLATVASAAPFAGLLGTVWGIYHALLAIGLSGQTRLDQVAGPVGEALVMTAIGLAVALPASIAHNAFARAHRATLHHLSAFANDMLLFVATGARPVDGYAPGRSVAPLTATRVSLQGI